jgi:hypothetical protein
MGVLRRIACWRFVRKAIVGAVFGTLSGCSAMNGNTPADLWDQMTPSKDTWDKFSPANIWYNLQPDQLHKLNREDEGTPPDAYY